MPSLKTYDWHSVYETGSRDEGLDLVGEFYRPALERANTYDRITGYFNSGGLGAAARGIESFVGSDGHMRLVVGHQLRETDRPVFEALTEELKGTLEQLQERESSPPGVRLLAWLLAEKRLDIRVAVPARDNWGIFHPKLGIFSDEDGFRLSFEGSVNETAGGWRKNFERFKVHRSWVEGQDVYVERDAETFERLWDDDHDYVRVHELPEAIRKELIDWQAPRERGELQTVVDDILDDSPEVSEDLKPEHIVARAGEMPGGLHLADELATIEPWPHQRVVSDTAVSAYPNGFMFSDEVGLGKTIEIGYTLLRLGLTGEVETALVLVPASLQSQWQEELWEKFNLPTYIHERAPDRSHQFVDPLGDAHRAPSVDEVDLSTADREQAWTNSPVWRFVRGNQGGTLPTIILMSWHTARLDSYHNRVAPQNGRDVRTRSDITGTARGLDPDGREGVWDVVVVDEAHNARRNTKLHELLTRLRAHVHCFYLASATPMQLHYHELHDLLSLFDLPGGWSGRNAFSGFFDFRQALVEALDLSQHPTEESEGEYQRAVRDRLDNRSGYGETISEAILRTLASHLGAADTEEVAERALACCKLVDDYGKKFDNLEDIVCEALDGNDVSGAVNRQSKYIRSLVRPDAVLGVVNERDKREALAQLDLKSWQALLQILKAAHPIAAYIHRNTRDTLRKYQRAGVLDESVPDRAPKTKDISLEESGEDAREAYERIEEYTTEFYKRAEEAEDHKNRAIGFVMTTYRQRLTSSVRAIQKSLQRRLEKLYTTRNQLDFGGTSTSPDFNGVDASEVVNAEDGRIGESGDRFEDFTPATNEEGRRLLIDEIEALEGFISQVQNIGEDPKLKQLRRDLRRFENAGHDRVLIFTQYTDTLEYVRDALKSTYRSQIATFTGNGATWWSEQAEGWVSVTKEQVKRSFADDDGRVEKLLGTSSMSEGLNLQFCGVLINYDLPWNPMKVEQRIGRIDRIGQKYDTIEIVNYKYEETVDGDIYDALDARIGMFEDVVGEVQPILSRVEKTIRSRVMEGNGDVGEKVVDQISEEEGRKSTVDIPDALHTVGDDDTTVEEDVRRDARLDAWKSYRHPDIDEIGVTSQETPPYDVESLEAALVGNQRLREAGVEFTPIDELPPEVVPDALRENGGGYLVTVPADWDESTVPEETLADTLVGKRTNTVAITFRPRHLDDYPSLRLLAPGDRLFATMINELDALELPPNADWLQVAWEPRTATLTTERGNLSYRIVGAYLQENRSIRLEDRTWRLDEGAADRIEQWGREFEAIRPLRPSD